MDEALERVNPVDILIGQVADLARGAVALLPNLVAAAALLLLTGLVAWGVARAIRGLLRRGDARQSLIDAITTLVKVAVWVVGLLIAATIVFPNLTPTSLLAGLGLGSVAVGLAFKDIFENFLAGFLILLRKPMRIGDDIDCEGLSGRVEQITIRDTFLRKRSGELVLVPNSHIFKNPVKILTDLPIRRIEVVIGVAFGEDVDEARKVIQNAMNGLDTVRPEKPVQVFASEFSASSIDFRVRWWAKSAPVDEHRSRDQAVAAIKRGLDRAGIEIPFPYRTLTFKEPLELGRPDDDARSAAD